MAGAIRACANVDHAYVAWQLPKRVDDCLGFALWRKRGDAEPEIMGTWVGFAGQPAPPGTVKASNIWPIQKFMWADYGARPGDVLRYRAVPMLGTPSDLEPDEGGATDWSDPVTAGAQAEDGFEAYFNRGIVATQWLARRLGPTTPATQLAHAIETPTDPTRDFLGGALRVRMLRLLDDAKTAQEHVYAALFELNDPELIKGLVGLGERAHVILANGSKPPDDENSAARINLGDAGVEVHSRMVKRGHLAHNKFLVVCGSTDAKDARTVWTGSTNWTKTGLCTQANNGLLVSSAELAGQFRAEWDALRDAGSDYTPALLNTNSQKRSATVGASAVTTWFVAVRDQMDLTDARARINAAKQGILFLMFNPGPEGTLLNDIVNRSLAGQPTFDRTLYVHGVLNQDPSTTAHPVIGLFHRGRQDDASFDVVLPEAVDTQLDFWVKELKKLPQTFAMVHSKLIVIDPFGHEPVVMTGSHNMGPKASGDNDDNLVIIENAPRLATAYAANIMGIYNQYRWRYWRSQHPSDDWSGLSATDTWQDAYFKGTKARELKFWLGQG